MNNNEENFDINIEKNEQLQQMSLFTVKEIEMHWKGSREMPELSIVGKVLDRGRKFKERTGDYSLRGKISFSCCSWLFIKVPFFQETSPALKNFWLRACYPYLINWNMKNQWDFILDLMKLFYILYFLLKIYFNCGSNSLAFFHF